MLTIDPPPFRIYLLRHAKSGWAKPDERDFDRTLDDQGYVEAEIVADIAADRNYRPDIVICSTAVRCRQTADAIRRAMDETLEMVFVDELYNAPLATYLALLAAQEEKQSVMLVGHNPTIEEALEALVGADHMVAAIPGGFPTAGLAVIDHRGVTSGAETGWVITDFITA
ncbi:histidine phosphatase family protein [Rhizobium sp. LCM 4573]|uniref:SixA phosphatase family protein n=1 Tax=Rhizobium sp. LCM 4573 TaxID=1848291 RepID=UPI0008DACA16|nr:histidine phosphatase family protein [Rhizobium sp. LCM 4573]OHV81128.1 phosphohistidine phosphatase [Rhizobium sp. LCM 4573]